MQIHCTACAPCISYSFCTIAGVYVLQYYHLMLRSGVPPLNGTLTKPLLPPATMDKVAREFSPDTARALRSRRNSRLKPSPMSIESTVELKRTYVATCGKEPGPIVYDLRGNSISSRATGHIHHPNNLAGDAWVRLAIALRARASRDLRPQSGVTPEGP